MYYIWMFVGVVAVALAIYAMINVLLARFPNSKKMVWFAIVVLVPIIGPIIYFLNRKSITAT